MEIVKLRGELRRMREGVPSGLQGREAHGNGCTQDHNNTASVGRGNAFKAVFDEYDKEIAHMVEEKRRLMDKNIQLQLMMESERDLEKQGALGPQFAHSHSSRFNMLETQLKRMKDRVHSVEEKYEELKKKERRYLRGSKHLETTLDKMKKLSRELAAKSRTVASLQAHNSKLRSDCERYELENRDLRADNEVLASSKDNMTQEVDTMRDIIRHNSLRKKERQVREKALLGARRRFESNTRRHAQKQSSGEVNDRGNLDGHAGKRLHGFSKHSVTRALNASTGNTVGILKGGARVQRAAMREASNEAQRESVLPHVTKVFDELEKKMMKSPGFSKGTMGSRCLNLISNLKTSFQQLEHQRLDAVMREQQMVETLVQTQQAMDEEKVAFQPPTDIHHNSGNNENNDRGASLHHTNSYGGHAQNRTQSQDNKEAPLTFTFDNDSAATPGLGVGPTYATYTNIEEAGGGGNNHRGRGRHGGRGMVRGRSVSPRRNVTFK